MLPSVAVRCSSYERILLSLIIVLFSDPEVTSGFLLLAVVHGRSWTVC